MNVKKAAAIFLALMAALTFLSRAMDSFTVIRVNTGFGKQDVVLYTLLPEERYTYHCRRICGWRKLQPGPDNPLRQETRS